MGQYTWNVVIPTYLKLKHIKSMTNFYGSLGLELDNKTTLKVYRTISPWIKTKVYQVYDKPLTELEVIVHTAISSQCKKEWKKGIHTFQLNKINLTQDFNLQNVLYARWFLPSCHQRAHSLNNLSNQWLINIVFL